MHHTGTPRAISAGNGSKHEMSRTPLSVSQGVSWVSRDTSRRVSPGLWRSRRFRPATAPSPPLSRCAVSPSSASGAGEQQTFTATVSNTENLAVTWSVNGIAGGNAAVGTIDANGNYTAPGNLSIAACDGQATSVADTSKSASATVQVSSDVSFSVSPSNSGGIGRLASICRDRVFGGKPKSRSSPGPCPEPDARARRAGWWIHGTYTAPQILPQATGISLTATSVADPSKSAAASIAITSSFTLKLTGPSTVFTRTVGEL